MSKFLVNCGSTVNSQIWQCKGYCHPKNGLPKAGCVVNYFGGSCSANLQIVGLQLLNWRQAEAEMHVSSVFLPGSWKAAVLDSVPPALPETHDKFTKSPGLRQMGPT